MARRVAGHACWPIILPPGLLVILVILLLATSPALAQTAPSFSVTSTSVTPDPLTPGATATITTSVTNNGGPASGIVVDMEIYDQSAVQVFQQCTVGHAFAAGETK